LFPCLHPFCFLSFYSSIPFYSAPFFPSFLLYPWAPCSLFRQCCVCVSVCVCVCVCVCNVLLLSAGSGRCVCVCVCVCVCFVRGGVRISARSQYLGGVC